MSQAVTASSVDRRGRQIRLRPWPEQPDTSDEPAGVRVELAGLSVTGPVRGRNEDRVGWAVPGDRVWVPGRAGDERLPMARLSGPIVVAAIADGLGGHADGDVASRFAITTLLERMAPPGALGRMADVLRGTFDEVNGRLLTGDMWEGRDPPSGREATTSRGTVAPDGREVVDGSHRRAGDEAGPGARAVAGGNGAAPQPVRRRRGSQTTLTAVALTATSAWIAHVGDCRVYRLRDQTLELLTTDHSQAMELLRMRLIRPDQAATHPGRHLLTRSLGGDITVRVDVRSGEIRDDDVFLLCTDGAWSGITSGEMIGAMEGDLEHGVRDLVDRSIARGADDNASVIALRILRTGAIDSSDEATGRRPLWRRMLGT